MKYIFIILLITGCECGDKVVKVDKHGITDEVHALDYSTKEGAIKAILSKIQILCLKHGYKGFKLLDRYIKPTDSNGYSAFGIGQCLRYKGFE